MSDTLLQLFFWIGGVVYGGVHLIADHPEEFGQQLIVQAVLSILVAVIIGVRVDYRLTQSEEGRQQREFVGLLNRLWPRLANAHIDFRDALLEVKDMKGLHYRTRMRDLRTKLIGIQSELQSDLERNAQRFRQANLFTPVSNYAESAVELIGAVRDVAESDASAAPSVVVAARFTRDSIYRFESALKGLNDALRSIAARLQEQHSDRAADTLRNAVWTEADLEEISAVVVRPLLDRSS